MKAKYRVHVGSRKYQYFATLEEATQFCSEVFNKTGIVLSIVEVK